MTARAVACLGRSVLRQVASPFSREEILNEGVSLANDMIATMGAFRGTGLAAPQIGVAKRLFVATTSGDVGMDSFKPTAFFNPRFEALATEKFNMTEGCLSIPRLFGVVPRHAHVTMAYTDVQGVDRRLWASGFIAGLLQHELDHLDGIMFVDRVTTPANLHSAESSIDPSDLIEEEEGDRGARPEGEGEEEEEVAEDFQIFTKDTPDALERTGVMRLLGPGEPGGADAGVPFETARRAARLKEKYRRNRTPRALERKAARTRPRREP